MENSIYKIANDLAMILGTEFKLELCSSTLISFSTDDCKYSELSRIGDIYCLSYTEGIDEEILRYEGNIKNKYDLLDACRVTGIFEVLKKESERLLEKIEGYDPECIFDRKYRNQIGNRLDNIEKIFNAKRGE